MQTGAMAENAVQCLSAFVHFAAFGVFLIDELRFTAKSVARYGVKRGLENRELG
jgi:hypothetical protein